jgi:hypothetical protein
VGRPRHSGRDRRRRHPRGSRWPLHRGQARGGLPYGWHGGGGGCRRGRRYRNGREGRGGLPLRRHRRPPGLRDGRHRRSGRPRHARRRRRARRTRCHPGNRCLRRIEPRLMRLRSAHGSAHGEGRPCATSRNLWPGSSHRRPWLRAWRRGVSGLCSRGHGRARVCSRRRGMPGLPAQRWRVRTGGHRCGRNPRHGLPRHRLALRRGHLPRWASTGRNRRSGRRP